MRDRGHAEGGEMVVVAVSLTGDVVGMRRSRLWKRFLGLGVFELYRTGVGRLSMPEYRRSGVDRVILQPHLQAYAMDLD